MKFSNYTLFYRELRTLGLERALDRTVKLGFDSIEHLEVPPDYYLGSLADAKRMRRELDARGLSVSCYSFLLDFLKDDIDAQIDRALRDIEYAHTIGSPFVHHTLVSGYDKSEMKYSLDEACERIADRAEYVARRINDYGMACLYEPQGLYFNGVHGVRKILSEMKSRGLDVGVCGDTGNSVFVDCMPIDIYRAFADDIRHIHVKDYKYADREKGEYTSFEGKSITETLIGEGSSDVAGCFALIPDYDASISFECSCGAEELKPSFDYVKSLICK